MKEKPLTAELKDRAREFLFGKYTPFAGVVLILIISYILSDNLFSLFFSNLSPFFSLQDHFILSESIWFLLLLFQAVLITSLLPGLCLFCLKFLNHTAPSMSDLFFAFKNNPQRNILLSLLVSIPRLLFLEPFQIYFDFYQLTLERNYLFFSGLLLLLGLLLSIPVDLFCAVSFFLLLDFPRYSVPKLFAAALKLLKKHWKKYLYLELSFLPVILLCILSLGIGLIWGIPYIAVTCTLLYLEVMKPGQFYA